jgi:NAD+ kinase
MRILYIESKDERVEKVNKLIEKNFPELLTEKDPELILVSGGDGAMLHAIQSFSHLNVPFLGHAMGTLNFLMNSIDTKELKRVIREIQEENREFNKINTAKIKVQVSSAKSSLIEEIGSAVNEVVIGSSVMGYHSFVINSEDKVFTNFEIKGSGLCISTDLGSTGYNFNLGGDILPLGSKLWSLSGIVCDKYLRDILQIGELEIMCSCKNSSPTIFLDGIDKKVALKKGDKVILKKDGEITLYFLDKEAFLSKRIEIISRYRRT